MKNLIVLLILVALTFSFKGHTQDDGDFDLNDFESKEEQSGQDNLKQRIRSRSSEVGMQESAPQDERSTFDRIWGGDESLRIPQIDNEVGVRLDTYSTNNDHSRASLAYMASGNLRDAASLSTIEFTYSKKFQKIWLEGSIAKTSAKTKRLTDYNSLVGNPTSELKEENSDLMQFGAGAMYRTTYIQNILPSSRFFETISAQATYNQFEDIISEQSYSGFGMKADFGIHNRLSPNFHLGAKFSYNLNTVKREAETEDESPNSRSLLLHWVSIGVDLSLYF